MGLKHIFGTTYYMVFSELGSSPVFGKYGDSTKQGNVSDEKKRKQNKKGFDKSRIAETIFWERFESRIDAWYDMTSSVSSASSICMLIFSF